MSRLLIIDTSSNGLSLALRAQAYGHEVLWFENRKDGEKRRAGEGLVNKTSDYAALIRKWLYWADLIYLTDNAKYMKMLEPFRLNGFPIFGGGIRASELEIDREYGQKAMKKAGMQIIPGTMFHDYKTAIKFVESSGKAYVSKPCWDAPKDLTYLANDAGDMVFMLEKWSKNSSLKSESRKSGFLLQEKISGQEMAVGGFFGPAGWNKLFLENFEYKKLMVGDLGPATGEMGNLAMAVKKSKLAEKVLLPITKQLQAIDYVGYVDNNCIVDDSGTPWPLEWTIGRDGCPIRYNRDSLIVGDPIQWMIDLIAGNDTMRMQEKTACISIVMALPPFPYQHKMNKELDGTPVYNVDTEHVHPVEMRLADSVPTSLNGKVIRMPGFVATDNYVCVVTGTGETITGARKSVYSAAKKIKMPSSPFYRMDIGRGNLVKGLPVLQKNGYAKEFKV